MNSDTTEGVIATPSPSVTISLPASDLDAMRAWYERLFGRSPDLVLGASGVEWRVQPGLWLHLAGGRPLGDGAGAVVRFEVDDIVRTAERLAAIGATIGPMRALGDGRACDVTDPFGNRLGLYSAR